MLNSRYDALKSGSMKPISGDEVIAHLREKSAAINACCMTGYNFHPEALPSFNEIWDFIAEETK